MSNKIESHLVEERVFKPSKEFSKKARISSMAQYRRMYKESIEKPSVFWAREAKELLWQKPWKKVLEWKAPFAKWFTGADRKSTRLNSSHVVISYAVFCLKKKRKNKKN